MTPNQYYKRRTKDECIAMCEAAGTSYLNFRQIAAQQGNCGKKLAQRLCEASKGVMTEMEILYPERYT